MIGDYLNFRDFFDGGGAGASGSEFKGGPISGLLNEIGVKPAGHADRTASMGQMPMMRPDRPAPAPAQAQPAPTQYAPSGMTPANAYVPTGTNPVTPYDEALRFIASQATSQPQYNIDEVLAAAAQAAQGRQQYSYPVADRAFGAMSMRDTPEGALDSRYWLTGKAGF